MIKTKTVPRSENPEDEDRLDNRCAFRILRDIQSDIGLGRSNFQDIDSMIDLAIDRIIMGYIGVETEDKLETVHTFDQNWNWERKYVEEGWKRYTLTNSEHDIILQINWSEHFTWWAHIEKDGVQRWWQCETTDEVSIKNWANKFSNPKYLSKRLKEQELGEDSNYWLYHRHKKK